MWQAWVEQQWQQKAWLYFGLRPLSWLFVAFTAMRRFCYRIGWCSSTALPVPVIVVGNLSVGGVGKTPLVLWLVDALKRAGYRPGIISRGYGGHATGWVAPDATAARFGDESVLLAKRSGCPVWVDANRVQAGQAILNAYPTIDVLVCDDGLQHYALKRCVEIVVAHEAGFGNRARLPAGPLRESLARLRSADILVSTHAMSQAVIAKYAPTAHYVMAVQPDDLVALHGDTTRPITALRGQSVIAVAGIGHPQRFFQMLLAQGLAIETRVFPDHHQYDTQDFAAIRGAVIVMTEKDAVKCQSLQLQNAWYLPITAKLQAQGARLSLDAQVIAFMNQRQGQNR